MADALDLGSSASRREGSSPSTRTKKDTSMIEVSFLFTFFIFRFIFAKGKPKRHPVRFVTHTIRFTV